MNYNGYCLRHGEKQGKIDCVSVMIYFLHHVMPDTHLLPFPEPPPPILTQPTTLPFGYIFEWFIVAFEAVGAQ